MAEETRRIDIGFQGGQVLPARVKQAAYDALTAALTDERSQRWFELETADSNVSIDLSQVVYVRIDTEAQRVGFQPPVLAALDLRLLRLLRTRGHWPPFERAVRAYAMAGENGLLWHGVAAAGLVLDRAGRSAYARTMRVTLVTLVANAALKRVVRRARPVLEQELPALVPTLSGRSYPSAHSSTSFAAAGALAHALPAPPLYAAATAMALSRPYLGVHYPSDVVAGALLGRAVERLL